MEGDKHTVPAPGKDPYSDYTLQKEMKRIQKLVDKWMDLLRLRTWRVHIEYHRDAMENKAATATCYANWQYLRMELHFFVPETCKLDDDKLEVTFLHECIHAHLDELDDREKPRTHQSHLEHEERVATTLAYVLRDTYEEGYRVGAEVSKGDKASKATNKKKG